MAYCDVNVKSKAELKRMIAAGEQVGVHQPGVGSIDPNGKVYLEGPWYPQPHRWYGVGYLKDGKLVSFK